MHTQVNRRSLLKAMATLPLLVLPYQRSYAGVMAQAPVQNQETANVLILVFDALSARHMSLYGYARATTPHLARFAERATVYHAHYAAGNFTTAGTASLLTGSYPWSHRALHFYGTVAENQVEKNLFHLFAQAGYYTFTYTHNHLAAILLEQFEADLDAHAKIGELCLFDANFFSEHLSPHELQVALTSDMTIFSGAAGGGQFIPSSLFLSMLHRLWRSARRTHIRKQYADLYPRGLPSTNGEPILFTLEDAIDWIKVQVENTPRPFLGYVHLYPPHYPYNPRRDFIGLFQDQFTPVAKTAHFFSEGYPDQYLNQQRRQYDEYIAYADAEFGQLYDSLTQTGVLDHTYVVVTADHGEMFERGISQHTTPTLYEPIMHVPLLISRPGQYQREDVYTPTSCVDLLPTLLRATGQAMPSWCEGSVLSPFHDQQLGDEEASRQRTIFCVEAKQNAKQAPLSIATIALVKGPYKLIQYSGYKGFTDQCELYNLVNDPEEVEDLSLSERSTAVELRRELETKLNEVNQLYLHS